MMGWTDRHYRFMMRFITKKALLYTEMIHAKAILHGDIKRLLSFSEVEKPLSLQLGGNDKDELKQCVQIACDYGYDEINLNVGCPSPKVQKGLFGASLMKDPNLVAEIVFEMKKISGNTPITVKSRIGIEGKSSYEDLHFFVSKLLEAGCDKLILHSRIAILKNISARKNRTIPNISYDTTYKIKEDFPSLHVEINGEIKTIEQIKTHLKKVDSVMIGRESYENPCFFHLVNSEIFGINSAILSRESIISQMKEYVKDRLEKDKKFKTQFAMRHTLNLFKNMPNRKFIQNQLLRS